LRDLVAVTPDALVYAPSDLMLQLSVVEAGVDLTLAAYGECFPRKLLSSGFGKYSVHDLHPLRFVRKHQLLSQVLAIRVREPIPLPVDNLTNWSRGCWR
jgi:hypothetical protein